MEQSHIWRTAELLLAVYGEAAPNYAARRIAEHDQAGDRGGADMWGEIMAAIGQLRMRKSAEDASEV